MHGRRIATFVTLIATGAFAAGCGDDDDETTEPPAAAKPAAFVIEATAAGKDKKSLTFPATVKSGLVTLTLRNEDTVPRSAQMLRVTGDQTVDDVLKIVNAEETKIPEFMQDGGGIATSKPGQTVTVTQVLAPGRWVIWDDEGGDGEDEPSNSELGAKGEFEVTGPASDAQLPAQPATVTATDTGTGDSKKYAFELEGLKAGANQVRFENTGEELHHALFVPIRDGVTIEEVSEVIQVRRAARGAAARGLREVRRHVGHRR